MHDLYTSHTEVSKASFEQPVEYPDAVMSILIEVKPPTGEPYAGDPPVRFGGEGGRRWNSPCPYPQSWIFDFCFQPLADVHRFRHDEVISERLLSKLHSNLLHSDLILEGLL